MRIRINVLFALLLLAALSLVALAVDPTHSVSNSGFLYATLDDADPNSTSQASQTNSVSIPNGWELVPVSQDANAMGSAYPWGTECLVVADGTLVPTQMATSCTSNVIANRFGGIRTRAKRVFIRKPVAFIASVVPNQVALDGNSQVRISGFHLGTGNDVRTVTLAGIAADIISQNASMVVVKPHPSTSAVTGDVVVDTATLGTAIKTAAFAYVVLPPANPPSITAVQPNAGPATGGYQITIVGQALGSGSDVTSVVIQNIAINVIDAQSQQSIVVTIPRSQTFQIGTADVTIVSTSSGSATLAGAFQFQAGPGIRAIVLPTTPVASGGVLTITGTSLGGDITTVTLNNVSAQVLSQTVDQVVVQFPPIPNAPVGSTLTVVVFSPTKGSMSFSTIITDPIPPASFPPQILTITPAGGSAAGGLSVAIDGHNMTNDQNDVTTVSFAGVNAASITFQNSTRIVAVLAAFNGALPASGPVVVTTSTRPPLSSASTFTYFAPGVISSVSPNRLVFPLSTLVNTTINGQPVTVRVVTSPVNTTISGTGLGSGSDITDVFLAGIRATIVSQTPDSVIVQPGALDPSVQTEVNGSVLVVSVSHGNTTLAGGFAYFPPSIVSLTPNTMIAVGGNRQVSIVGQGLGTGTDIVAVRFGNLVAAIVSQTENSVVVTLPDSSPSTVIVEVQSTSRGVIRLANGFTFVAALGPPVITSLVPNSIRSAGGDRKITISGNAIGSGTDITSVLVGTAAATIAEQTPNSVVVTVPDSTPGVVNVTVSSASRGVSSLNNGFTFIAPPAITSITPNTALTTGGNRQITISGTGLGSGSDITSVQFGAINAAIVSQTDSLVVVTVPDAQAGAVTVTVSSTSRGVASSVNAFTFTAAAVSSITSITPNTALTTGGNRQVTIAGQNLGSGGDITSVLFGSVAAVVMSQTDTNVVVNLPDAAAGVVSVTVTSTSRGAATSANAFTFTAPLTSNITSIVPNTALTTGGNRQITISGQNMGSGTDITSVQFGTLAAVIVSQTSASVIVTVPDAAAGVVSVTVSSTARGPVTSANSFTFTAPVVPAITTITPNTLFTTGGVRQVTINGQNLGSGADITSVVFGNITAAILAQTDNNVTVNVPTAAAGTVNVVTTSTSRGPVTSQNAFTFATPVAVALTSVNPTTGSADGGIQVTLVGSGFGAINSVVFGVSGATILSQTTSQVVVRLPNSASGAGAVAVSVFSNAGGQASLANAFTFTAGATALPASQCPGGQYLTRRLVSDAPETTPAFVNPTFRNPWGVAHDPNGNFYVCNGFLGVISVIQGSGAPVVLGNGDNYTITVPRAANPNIFATAYSNRAQPSAAVWHSGAGFNVPLADGTNAPAQFIVVSLDGGLFGYHEQLSASVPARAVVTIASYPNSAFTGCALGVYPTAGTTGALFVADFLSIRVRIWNDQWQEVTLAAGVFADPNIPTDFAPFNVYINAGRVFVAYSRRNPTTGDKIRDVGLGFVSQFDLQGAFVKRVADGGNLAAPYGMVISPPSFGPQGGRMFIGNFGNGQLLSYDHTLAAPGPGTVLTQSTGTVFAANGLHALEFGNGLADQATNIIFMSAGLGNETRGMWLRLTPSPCPPPTAL